MKKSWLSGLDSDAKEIMTGDYERSLYVRQRLEELIETKIKSAETEATSKDAYNVANWAYLQADLVGYKRALKEIIELIS